MKHLLFLIIILLVPVKFYAASSNTFSQKCEEGYYVTYFISGDHVEVGSKVGSFNGYPTGCAVSKDAQGTITIPSEVEYLGKTYTVTSIGQNAFKDCSLITSVILPETIHYIGQSAFSGCSSLDTISLPDSVKQIGNETFLNCSSLKSIDLSKVTDLRSYAFKGCSELESIVFPLNLEYAGANVFYICRKLKTLYVDNLDNFVRASCRFGGFVRQEDCHIFHGNSEVTKIVIPNDVIEINAYAFSGIAFVEIFILPDGLQIIGERAFENCSSLSELSLPNSLTSIGECAFWNCTSLTEISIPSKVLALKRFTFACCSNLYAVSLSEGVDTIEERAFGYCRSLSELSLPNSLTCIGEYAFYDDSALKTVTIPFNVSTIGNAAFYGCSSLSSVEVNINSFITIQDGTFEKISDSAILYVPYGQLDKYKNNNSWKRCFIDVREKAPIKGLAFIASMTQGNTSINVNATVVSTNPYQVELGSDNINAIPVETIGEFIVTPYITGYDGLKFEVVGIHDNAFYGSNITSIYLPDNVTYIGSNAFKNSVLLESLHIPQSTRVINDHFSGCNTLKNVFVQWRVPSEITIPKDAFSDLTDGSILYVPAGTKERYEVLEPWNKFSQIVESSPISVGDISARYGSKASLPIYLKNTESVLGIQFKLTLPEGVSVIENNGNLVASTTERTEGMTIMGRKDQDEINSYLFVALSLAGNSIIGSEGAIMNIQLEIAEDVELGIYDIKIEDVYLATESFDTLNPSESTSELTIKDFILGDINSNGNIDIGDAVSVVSYLVGKPLDCFIEEAADMNQNGQIDIGDAVSILNVLVGKVVSNAAPQLILGENDREPQ